MRDRSPESGCESLSARSAGNGATSKLFRSPSTRLRAKGPELLAEAKKANFAIDYVSGEDPESIFHGLYKIEPSFAAKLKQVLAP